MGGGDGGECLQATDVYKRQGVGGQYYKYANFGDMTTRGVELGIHSKNIVTEKFSWSSSLTISGMSQMITRLLNSPNAFDMVAGRGRGNLVGYPKGSLFSFCLLYTSRCV